MPVILTEKNVINWLGNAIQSNEIADLLKPYPHDLDYYPVSTFVNYAANNSPECIKDLDHGN
jgi:putative SOS response-associated peptidase YedK